MDKPEENEPQNKRIRIEPPPLEAANPDEEDHEESGEELSYINRLPDDIFYIIFEEIDCDDVFRVAMVCRRWLEIANYVKKSRPFCFATSYMSATGEFNFAFIPESIKPFVGFFFLGYRAHDDHDNNVTDAICKLLPPNCKTIILFTFGGSLNKNTYSLTTPSSYMLCALLLENRNVQLKTVLLHSSIQDSILGTYTEYTQMIETASGNLDHESFMCLMLFCDRNNPNLALRMAQIAKSTFDHNKKVSFCGGEVVQLRTNNKTNPLNCVALLITGSIRTWSIVLEKEIRLLAEEKLQKFKEQVKLRKHAVGFVFFSWNTYIYDVRDKEITIFKKLFPNVPLIGCGCVQVFGRDIATYEAKFFGLESSQWYKNNSITFMILTYG